MLEVDVIGGGLSGLTAATLLARGGAKVRVFEKKRYPCVKLCGEFLSPEGMNALCRLAGANVEALELALNARRLSRFTWVSRRGRSFQLDLKPGGWAVRRDILDPWLARLAETAGVDVQFGRAGDASGAQRKLWATGKEHEGLKSPFFAIKGYVQDLPALDALDGRDIILFQLRSGYIGFTRMAGGELSYCALLDRRRCESAWRYVTWKDLCEGVFCTNVHLLDWAGKAHPLLKNHIGAARFDFKSRLPVRDGKWFAGDAAQLVPPFVGDGMSMAIEGGELAARGLLEHQTDAQYLRAWKGHFYGRFRLARLLHPLLWLNWAHEPVIGVFGQAPGIAQWIYTRTRGR